MSKTLVGMCLVGLLLVGGCSSKDDSSSSATATPASACASIVQELCAKFFGCFTKDELSASAALVGNNEADCRDKFGQQQCTDQKLKCDSGMTYSQSKATECLNQFKSLSCSEFGNGTSPAACDAICQ